MKKINWWKWGIIAALCIALFLWGRSCGLNSVTKITDSDTTVTRDSIILKYIPVPYKVEVPVKSGISHLKKKGDSLICIPDTLINHIDTSLERYNEIVYYSDTTKYGVISDTITKNRIIGRGLTMYSNDTTIYKEEIIYPQKTSVVYFSISAQFILPINAFTVGAGVMYKTKNDIAFEYQYFIDPKVHQVSFKIPIKLRK